MGFLERSRSLRRQEKDTRKRSATVSAAQREPKAPTPENVSRGEPNGALLSRGFGTQKGARPRTAGRERADDEALPPPPSMEILSGEHTFRFPSPSPRQSSSSMTYHRNSSTIGIALGSPRQIPGYQRSFTSPAVPQASVENGVIKISAKLTGIEHSIASSTPKDDKEPRRPTLHKSKSSTWKSFFQRKPARPAMPDSFGSSELPPVPVQDKAASADGKKSVVRSDTKKASQPSSHIRGESRGDVRRNLRAELDKAHFEQSTSSPVAPKVAQSKFSAQARPSPARSNTANSESSEEFFDAVSRKGSDGGLSLSQSPKQPPSMPRLDISIPDVEMERYSVMFEKLLKPHQSIMERRHTHIKKLQLPEESAGRLTPALETPGRMQRRATSPNLAVHTPLTAEALESSSQMATPVPIYRASGGPRLLQRSQTAPPGAVSPGRARFEQQQRTANTSTAGSENSPLWSETSLPPTPTTASDAETFISLDYGDEDDEDVEIVTYHHAKPMIPHFKDVAWDMTTRAPPVPVAPPPIPPKAASRGNSPPRTDTSALANAAPQPAARQHPLQQHPLQQHPLQQHPMPYRPPRTSSLGNEEHKARQQQQQQQQQQQAAQAHRPIQISVARQVSVVRRPSAASLAQVQAQQQQQQQQARSFSPKSQPAPVFSKQPLKPKVVEVRNRKSTVVVLDSA
ncbi:hypothetical protein MBLNU459_g0584t1 [Dothideomycetes sp. NU459]